MTRIVATSFSDDNMRQRIRDLGGFVEVDADTDSGRRWYDVYLDGAVLGGQDIAGLNQRDDVRSLFLRESVVDEAVASDVLELPALCRLELEKSNWCDEWCKRLGGCTELCRLTLGKTRVTDNGLADVANLGQLELLAVDHCAVTDRGIAYLDSLPNLQALYLDGTAISVTALEIVAGLEHLELLSVCETSIGDEGIARLRGCRDLTVLEAANTAVVGQCFRSWRGPLELLNVSNAHVTDDEVSCIADITTLTSIDLTGNAISDKCLEHLCRLDRLQEVYLGGTAVTQKGVNMLIEAYGTPPMVYQ